MPLYCTIGVDATQLNAADIHFSTTQGNHQRRPPRIVWPHPPEASHPASSSVACTTSPSIIILCVKAYTHLPSPPTYGTSGAPFAHPHLPPSSKRPLYPHPHAAPCLHMPRACAAFACGCHGCAGIQNGCCHAVLPPLGPVLPHAHGSCCYRTVHMQHVDAVAPGTRLWLWDEKQGIGMCDWGEGQLTAHVEMANACTKGQHTPGM